MGALDVVLSHDILARLDTAINQNNVSGNRYNEAVTLEVDTESF
jgi:hypothetical protein